MTSYVEIANLGHVAQEAVHELRVHGGQVPITRLGRPTGAHMVVAEPDASVTLPDAIEEARRLLAAFDDVRPDDMADAFHIHAYNELTIVLRDLLDALGAR
ncbi:hypothetical protein [Cellulosimicrobium composti]|uniref:Type II toxin-antitoxin system Phd/YefM family antitoxin n=1 Tax=Cellulosimicrobium composti TaxID=2672572 RepID=A0ABX0BBZ9_9MICO|nr:hypothetical protein [Cellulosimicrobium composti]NDO90132.1 hypothetical protein [Cellulosimicrobium composti]